MKILRKAGTVLLAVVMCLSSFFAENVQAQEPDKEQEFEYVQTFLSDGTFIPPRTGLYRFYVIGPGGNGGAGGDGQNIVFKVWSGTGGGSGGFGGYGVHEVVLQKEEKSKVFISETETKLSILGTNIVAEKGGNGGDGIEAIDDSKNIPGVGGKGGECFGANIANLSGLDGNSGRLASISRVESHKFISGDKGGSGGGTKASNRKYTNNVALSGGKANYDRCNYRHPDGTIYNYADGDDGNTLINTQYIVGTPGSGGGGASAKTIDWEEYNEHGGTTSGYDDWHNSGGAGGKGAGGGVIVEVCKDTTPPVIDSVAFSKDRKRVTLTASDEYGIAGYYINGTFVEGNPLTYSIPSGTVQLTIQAEDNAGNRSPEQIVDVLPAAPNIFVAPDKPWLNAADGKAIVTLSTDAEGIFEDVKLWYSLDGGAGWTPYSSPFKVTETCMVTAKVSCKNGDSDTAQKEIKIDPLAPCITSATVDETDMEHRFLTVTAEDSGGSGVKCIWIDDTPYTDNPCTYPIPDGKETVMLKVEDVAGNPSKPKEQVVRHIDTIPPTIDTVEFTKDLSVVTIRMSDDTYGDGVKGVYINGTFKTGNPILWAVPEDVAILRLQAEDEAGNKSEIRREHVPGRMAILDTITIESVTFSEDNTMATVTAATSEPGTTIRGIYCNEELVEGNPATYKIPIENSQYLKMQAVNNEGDRSELVTKRVPGWTEVTDNIAVTSVEFLKSNTRARVRADTTRKSRIMGIYVNKEFYDGNPIECPVTSVQLECQAVDEYGDLSQPVVRQVPAPEQPAVKRKHKKDSGGGTGSTTRIFISDPELQKDGQYRVDISAKDSECDIEKIVAVYDGHKEDITRTRFLLLDEDTFLQVIAVNDDGRMTYKKVRIRLEKEPKVEELEEKEVPISGKSKRTTKSNVHPGSSALAGGTSQSSDSNSQDDTKERLAQLLQQQRLKQYEDQPMPKMETNPEISETIRRTSASNQPGVAAVAASVLCFLALMVMVVLLVVKQQKASAYCKQVGTAKKG